jgi:hypothetical protein
VYFLPEGPQLEIQQPECRWKVFRGLRANRYTGELVIEQKIMGTFNLCPDAPNVMEDGKLPTTGDHDALDIIPHKEYGGIYRQIATGIVEAGSLEKGPVILAKLDD